MSEKIATREAYGKALVELGEQNEKVVVLDADLAGATMTKYFKAAHPDRFFDCGIAEANMMNIGAGLSTMGAHPLLLHLRHVRRRPCLRADPKLHCLPQVQREDLLFPRRCVCG